VKRPRLLFVNPNTSGAVTGWLAEEARRVAGDRFEVAAVNAASGLMALETPADVARAAEAVVAAIEADQRADAAVIGAFGDPGLEEARTRLRIPVSGLGEAGLRAAAAQGRRFSIVTLGEAMRAPIAARVRALGLERQLAEIRILPMTIAGVIASRDAHLGVIADAVRAAPGEAVLLGGAPFAGLAARIAEETGRAVLDGVAAAVAAVVARLFPLGSDENSL
jgi:Asp/Glu/hydantoin racemase